MKNELIDKVTAIVGRAGRSSGIEAVEVQWLGSGRQRLLRIFIDKPQGVTHGDCETISQYVGTVLDAEDAIPGGSYTLEVSSPGIERKLIRPEDYERFAGKKAKIVLRQPLPGDSRRSWQGRLAGYHDGLIRLEPPDGDAVEIPLTLVERANLRHEW
jgi:ribosome maturation factor RimP